MPNTDTLDAFSRLKSSWAAARKPSSSANDQTSNFEESSRLIPDKSNHEIFNSLFAAALEGDKHKIILLIDQGADLHGLSLNEWGLAHALAYGGRSDILEELFEKGLNIHLEGPNGMLPIQVAARSGNLSIVKWFIEKDLIDRPLEDLDLLHHIAEGNFEKLAQEFQGDQNKEDKDVFLYQTVMSKYLIEEHNLDVNTKNSDNWTPLHLAARNGNTILMSLLIAAGSDLNVPGDLDKTPMYEAISGGHLDAVKLLASKGVSLKDPYKSSESCPMHLAVESGHIHIMEYLMEQGIDHFKDNKGEDLISCAAEHVQLHVMKWYSERGVDIKDYLENCYGMDGPRLDLEILQWFQSIGFDFTQPLGPVPLMHMAVSESRIDIMEYLRSQGVDINEANHQGMTSVHRAAWCGQIKALKYLKSQDVDFNQENKYGQTPIFDAIQSGNFEVINYLVENGADLTKKDKDGNTLMHIAAGGGRVSVIQWLLDKGLPVDTLNNDDESPLDIAVKSDLNVKVIRCLEVGGALITAEEIEEMEPIIFYSKDMLSCLAHTKAIRIDLIDWLIDHNVQNNFIAQFILSLISEICKQGRLDKLEVVEKYAKELALTEENVQDLIKYAAMHQKPSILKWLLDKDVNIGQAVFEIEDAPYNINCQIMATKWICQYGISCHVSDDVEEKLLEHATQYNNPKVIEFIKDVKESGGMIYLPKDTDQNPIMHQAAASGDIELIKELYKEGADLNATDANGNTPLHHAVSQKALGNNFEAIKFLVENGVNFNATNNNGDSPLKLAIDSKRYEAVLLLCSLEAKIDPEDRGITDFFSEKEDVDKTFVGDDLVCQKKAILHLISSFEGTIGYHIYGVGQILESKAAQIKADMENEAGDIAIKHNNTLESLDYTPENQGDPAVQSIDLGTPKNTEEEIRTDVVGDNVKTESNSCCCVIS